MTQIFAQSPNLALTIFLLYTATSKYFAYFLAFLFVAHVKLNQIKRTLAVRSSQRNHHQPSLSRYTIVLQPVANQHQIVSHQNNNAMWIVDPVLAAVALMDSILTAVTTATATSRYQRIISHLNSNRKFQQPIILVIIATITRIIMILIINQIIIILLSTG